MSIEYRDAICNRPLDANGFELPPWLNPFLCDYCPELAAMPELTEKADHTAADEAWLAANPLPASKPFEPSDEDWRDYHEWSEHLDRLDKIRSHEDAMDELCRRYAL